ncbi:hypothetical protein D9M70_308860 [compost metagenome]
MSSSSVASVTWSLKELKDDVTGLYGKERCDQLLDSLESIVDRSDFAKYHFHEFERLLSEFMAGKEDDTSIAMALFGADEEEEASFQKVRMQAVANVIACMQSMHAVADTLSHVIYFSLDMQSSNDSRLAQRSISIHSVRQRLTLVGDAHSLHKLIGEFVDHQGFIYLNDVVNQSKHRSLIGTSYTLNMTGVGRLHGLEFKAFKREGRTYGPRWVDDYLKEEFSRQSRLIIQIGQELNGVVRRRK